MATKIIGFADNDTTDDAEQVNAAIIAEPNVNLYYHIGDGPYAKSGTQWTSMMDKSFGDKKDRFLISRGNHDEDESESKQTQKDIEAWFPASKELGISDCWLNTRQIGNVYVINMDTQDLRVEFEDEQFNWVKAELAKAKQLRAAGTIDWIVCACHKPWFTLKSSHSPYTAVRFQYKDLFRDAQVDFMLHGHNHNTQLWFPMIPNQSQANGEGEQLFKYASDGKTFDFTQDHGAAYIVTGHAGHEWNEINDSGPGVANVQHYRDSGEFGYTILEFDGKKAKVSSKDTAGKVHFEYNVTREGGTPPPPPPPPGCLPSECKDKTTGQCRQMLPNETTDVNGFCVPTTPPPPPGPEPTCTCPPGYKFDKATHSCIKDSTLPPCPPNYYWNTELGKCIPVLEPPVNPPPPPGCPSGQCKDPVTKQCRPLQDNEQVDIKTGECIPIGPPPPPPECPDGQCKDPVTQQCRAIGADEEKDVNGFCKKKNIPPPPPEGEVLWDSNVHLKVTEETKVTDTFGSQEINGKGVFMAASGSPRLLIYPNGEFDLEADSGHGRVYIQAQNYNARMEGELRFNDNAIRNTTLRLRSRHNEGGDCKNRFGGFGATVEKEEQLAEFSTEPCHNIHSNTDKKPLEKDLVEGQWVKFRYSVCDTPDKGAIQQKLEFDYNDGAGFKTVNEATFDSVEPYMMTEADFLQKRSYAWLRVNNESTGKVTYRNVRIVKIDSIT